MVLFVEWLFVELDVYSHKMKSTYTVIVANARGSDANVHGSAIELSFLMKLSSHSIWQSGGDWAENRW
jgi:hypothetical protein